MAKIVAITSSTSLRRVSAIGSGFAIGLALRNAQIGPSVLERLPGIRT